jgi:hypothetical protein
VSDAPPLMDEPVTAYGCPHPGCPLTRPDAGSLTAHLVDDHLVSAAVAFQQARAVVYAKPGVTATVTAPRISQPIPPPATTEVSRNHPTRTDPYGLDRNGIKKAAATKETTMAKARLCRKCRQPGHRANKCPSATGRGKPSPRAAKTKALAVPSNGRDVAGAKALLERQLEEEIVEKQAELRVLERLRARMA